jgi:hypothetical protein
MAGKDQAEAGGRSTDSDFYLEGDRWSLPAPITCDGESAVDPAAATALSSTPDEGCNHAGPGVSREVSLR